MIDIEKIKRAALVCSAYEEAYVNLLPEDVLELIARLEAAEQDAAIGNWLCNYMASEQVDLDDYLIEACHYDDPAKFKAAILAAMKESK